MVLKPLSSGYYPFVSIIEGRKGIKLMFNALRHYTKNSVHFVLCFPLLLAATQLFALELRDEAITPIPAPPDLDPALIELGKQLFHEPKLSADGTVACANCHMIPLGGVDRQPRSLGIKGQRGVRNAPTVLNASLHFAQFWDGRAATLEEQAKGPITNPIEMGNSWDNLIQTLEGEPHYRRQFQSIYSDGITPDNITHAIATFERTLVTPDGRFDRYLKGDNNAINDKEKVGFKLFKSYGCISCHQGRGVGGNMYEKMGVFGNYFTDRGEATPSDYGRFNVTGVEEHRFEFKVPSLRNVTLTPPYFHDGSVKTLELAVKLMGKYQLGRTIPSEDIDTIVAFLKTLTGREPKL